MLQPCLVYRKPRTEPRDSGWWANTLPADLHPELKLIPLPIPVNLDLPSVDVSWRSAAFPKEIRLWERRQVFRSDIYCMAIAVSWKFIVSQLML